MYIPFFPTFWLLYLIALYLLATRARAAVAVELPGPLSVRSNLSCIRAAGNHPALGGIPWEIPRNPRSARLGCRVPHLPPGWELVSSRACWV